ncbi:MAG: lytic murein transglycosylase [Candidatus Moraniibacteriota bacterium]
MRIKTNKHRLIPFFVSLLSIWGVVWSVPLVSAQDDPDEIKDDISDVEKKLKAAEAKKKALESELAGINASLSSTQRAIAEAQIKIQQAANTIERKEAEVALLERQIEGKKEIITGLMRELYYQGEWPLPRVLVAEERFTDVVNDPDKLLTVGEKISTALDSLSLTKADTESEKLSLEDAKKDHETLLQQKAVEKIALVSDQQETLGDVEDVAKTVSRLSKELNELQSDLNALTGGSYDAGDIKEAVTYASGKTGVPKGFLMGMLKMETNLGKNVGGCTYAEVEKGAESRYKSGKLSKASWATFQRRREVFKSITKELGYDYKKKKVSCNPSGYTGTGGAMGVAQFMPDTWMGYKSQVASKTGHNPPDPWNLTDGVMAMATKLSKTPGVTSGSRSAWKKAAASYLGTSYAPYINGVLYWADNYKKLF